MKLEEAKTYYTVFKLNLAKVKRNGFKSKEQKGATQNIEMLHNAREVIKLFDDNSTIASKPKYKTIQGEKIKILTPQQMV